MNKLYSLPKNVSGFIKAACIFVCVLFPHSSDAQINVTSNQTAAVLAQKLVGTGVTVMNPTLTCYAQGNGIFSVTSSNLGLDSGIVLTNGLAKTVNANNGPFGVNSPANKFADNADGTPGDAQLTVLAGEPTYDACILQFDFRPAGDTIKFDYVFGSEEYTDYTCTEFNDVFGFFITGPGYATATNIALVPGTDIPVCINSVNGATPSNNFDIGVCNAVGPGSPFNQYFVNNINGATVTYDGLTTVLQAIAAVTPCDTFHLKLGVADATDDIYDSGVFIKAGSLSSNAVSITPEGLGGSAGSTPYCVRGCLPGKFIFSVANPSASSQTISYEIAGTAVNGYDYATIADSVVIPADSTTDTLVINTLGVPPTGPKTVELLIVSNVGCGGASAVVDSATLIIYDSINVHIITPDTAVCAGQSVNIMAQGDSFLVYNWTPVIGLNNDTTLNPIATPTDTTTYEVTASFPGGGCAPSSDQVTIAIVQPPTPYVNAPYQTICVGSPIQFIASATPATQPYTYSWSPTTWLNNPAISNPVCTPQQLNDITYTVIVNSPLPNCSSFDTIHLHVLPNDFTLYNKDSAFCLGATIQINASGDSEFTYVWTPTTGVSNPNIINPSITVDTSGTYTITATYPGCPDMSHQLTYNVEKPVADIITPDTAFCLLDSVQLSAIAEPGNLNYTYLWTPATGLSDATILDPKFFDHTAGSYTFYLTVTTDIGCSSTDSVTLTSGSPIHVVVNPASAVIPYGSSIQLSATNTYPDPLYYVWMPNDGSLDNPNIGNPVATPLDSTTYTVIGINEYGCRDTDTVTIVVNFSMNEIVPNAFSPNGDGKNDVFRILNIKYQRLVDFSVFNRWGQIVFHTTNADEGWDGTFNGVPQEMGTYDYMISLVMPDGSEKLFKGIVTLVR